MTTFTFDTLAYAKRLQDAGIPQAQAEAMTEALQIVLSEAFSNQQALAVRKSGCLRGWLHCCTRRNNHD